MIIKQPNDNVIGTASAVGAYLLWGFMPIYWKLINQVPSFESLAHRIIWSFFLMLLILLAAKKIRTTFCQEVRMHPQKGLGIIIMAGVISLHWFTWIWAVNNNHVVETSLGYYINPLVSVMLGIIFLKEKLSFWQMFSFFLALVGVLIMTVKFGAVPWVALVLALTFGLYGLFKKKVKLGAITGLTLETMMIMPFAFAFLWHVYRSGNGSFGFDAPDISILLMGTGIVNAIPLLLFASSANRLPLSVVGFLQYIEPTILLFLAVFLYHEPFTSVHLVSFVFIWIALIIFALAKTQLFIQLEHLIFKKVPFLIKEN